MLSNGSRAAPNNSFKDGDPCKYYIYLPPQGFKWSNFRSHTYMNWKLEKNMNFLKSET